MKRVGILKIENIRGLVGLGKKQLKLGMGYGQGGASIPPRKRKHQKCAFFLERGREHGCTFKGLWSLVRGPKRREWKGYEWARAL